MLRKWWTQIKLAMAMALICSVIDGKRPTFFNSEAITAAENIHQLLKWLK